MAIDFEKDERTGRLLLTDLPVTKMAGRAIDVRVGQALVGRVEQLTSGFIELFLLQPLKESGRAFRLDENLNDEGKIDSVELVWI